MEVFLDSLFDRGLDWALTAMVEIAKSVSSRETPFQYGRLAYAAAALACATNALSHGLSVMTMVLGGWPSNDVGAFFLWLF
jgi:hypothetical protein